MTFHEQDLTALEAELERRIAEPAPLDHVGCIHCGKAYGFHVKGCPQDVNWFRALRVTPQVLTNDGGRQ